MQNYNQISQFCKWEEVVEKQNDGAITSSVVFWLVGSGVRNSTKKINLNS